VGIPVCAIPVHRLSQKGVCIWKAGLAQRDQRQQEKSIGAQRLGKTRH
jgi:hypothetical protein